MNEPKDREAILYAFAVEPNHDQATLEHYLRQYPELAEELVDLSYELRITETREHVKATSKPEAEWKEAWQQFVACEPGKANLAHSGDLFARFKGQAFADLATSLKTPRSFLAALRDRLVDPLSIPDQFIRRFAESTESTIQAVREYFSLSPGIIRTAQFKADKKPSQQGQISFEKLVESTQMTDEERRVLLEDLHSDGRK